LSYQVIRDTCLSISQGELNSARLKIASDLPFVPLENAGRKYSDVQKTRLYLRDGFIDRYSGEKLVFPPVLRLMSKLMPAEFPYHPNWKMTECHIAYWQLSPTIDHIVPVARGGADDETNWACTSQLRNSAKANWLLEELDWQLQPPGDLQEWDGLIHWYVDYANDHPEMKEDPWLWAWLRTAEKALNEKL